MRAFKIAVLWAAQPVRKLVNQAIQSNMITANLVRTWEHFRAVQVHSLVLMKNALTVITNPDVSPVMTGTKRHRLVRLNVKVLTNILAQVQAMPGALGKLVMENINHVIVLLLTRGTDIAVL